MDHRSKGEITRDKIVAEAAIIFNQRGYEGTSMHDIMAATGLQKGGLYRHFASKEALASAAFLYAWGEAMASRVRDLDKVKGAIPKLQHMVDSFVATRSRVPGGCPLMNTAIEADDGNPILRRLALDALRQWQQLLEGIVKNGIKAGEIGAEVSPTHLANRIIAMLEGALMISRLERSRDAIDDARSSLRTHLELISRARNNQQPQ